MKLPFRTWAPAALSAALALAVYSITLAGTYIYDDVFLIKLDPRVQTPRLWRQFWTDQWMPGKLDNLYRPLVSQSFALEWWLHGDRPWAFHLINLLLNAAVCSLVAELGRRLVNWRVGLIAGLLFACHPIHSEAVAGIAGRAELACALGVVGAMVLFLERPMTFPRAIAIFALAALAMLSKEQGLLLPFLLAALLPARPALFPTSHPAERKHLQVAFILVMYSVCALIILREFVLPLKFDWDRSFLDYAAQPLKHSPPTDRWLIPLALLGRYFQLLVAPVKLSIDYGIDVINPTIRRQDPYLLLGVAVLLAGFVATAIALRRRQWVVCFCLIAMALTYSAASNIVIIGTIFGERLMYLPSAFFLILIAIGIARLPAAMQIILVTALVFLGSLRTWTYVQRWNNRDAFYEYSLAQQPDSLKIALLVSYVDYEEARFDASRQILDRALSRHPDYWELWMRSALIAEKLGDWQAAVDDWKHAFDLQPSQAAEDQLSHDAKMLHDQLAHPATAPSAR